MSEDVFKHDNGVIDHKADGEDEGQKRQRVKAVAHKVHGETHPYQRDGYGDERNEGRAHRAQEKENDGENEDDRLDNRLVDRADGAVDEDRAVVGDVQLHALRQGFDDGRKDFLDFARNREGVRGRLLDDAKRDGVFTVESHHAALVHGRHFRAADVFQAHEARAVAAQDEVFKLLHAAKVGFGEHREFALLAFDAARRNFDVLAAQRRFDLGGRQFRGGHAQRVEPQAHGLAALAQNDGLCDAVDVLQPVLHIAVGVIGDFHRGMAVAGESEIDDRARVGLRLRHLRVFGLVGQAVDGARDAVAHVVGGVVDIARYLETDADVAAFGAAGGGHDLDALDARESVFQRLGHLRFHDLRARAEIAGRDGNDGLVDVRVLAKRQAVIGNKAQKDQEEAHHRGENGAADAKLWQGHWPPAGSVAGCSATAMPSRIFIRPALIIFSPFSSPSLISTVPSARSPSVTFRLSALPSLTMKT